MKNIFYIIIALVSIQLTASGQSDTSAPSSQIGLSIGLANEILWGEYMHPLSSKVQAGLRLGSRGFRNNEPNGFTRGTYFFIEPMARVIPIEFDKTRPYIGVGLNLTYLLISTRINGELTERKYTKSANQWVFHFGVQHQLKPNLHLTAEFTNGRSALVLGLARDIGKSKE